MMKQIFSIITLFSIIALFGCDTGLNTRDGDVTPENNIDIESEYRVIEIIYSHPSSNLKYEFSYNNNKVSEALLYSKDSYDNWKNDFKIEITYSGENITEIGSVVDDYGATQYDWKEEYSVQNGLILRYKDYSYENYSWVPDSDISYSYNSNKLVQAIFYEKDDGTNQLELSHSYNYEYNNDNISTSLYYSYSNGGNIGEVDPTWKYEFTFSGSNMTEYIHSSYSNYSWNNVDKIEYSYNGDKPIYRNEYEWDSYNWNKVNDISYTYDIYGNLSTITYSNENYYDVEYVYEKAKGNYRSVWLLPNSMLYGRPNATKRSKNIRLINEPCVPLK